MVSTLRSNRVRGDVSSTIAAELYFSAGWIDRWRGTVGVRAATGT